MALKEVHIDPDIGRSSELVFMPPVLDRKKAKESQRIASDIVRAEFGEAFPGLTQSVALMLYSGAAPAAEYTLHDTTAEKIGKIINAERQALAFDYTTPLPTLGFEVEAPVTPFLTHGGTLSALRLDYDNFCTMIGLPYNRGNSSDSYQPELWEFAPSPTYAAFSSVEALQALFAARLIPQFDPELTDTDFAAVIQRYSKKLISFHINIGIPDIVVKNMTDIVDDSHYLSAAFALAFTSPTRMRNRTSNHLTEIKSLNATHRTLLSSRIEMKALELRTPEDAGQLFHAQMLWTALCAAHYKNADQHLASFWDDLREKIAVAVPEDIVETANEPSKWHIADSNIRMLAEEPRLQQYLRPLLRQYSSDIAAYIGVQT